jgi:hypothetical protein
MFRVRLVGMIVVIGALTLVIPESVYAQGPPANPGGKNLEARVAALEAQVAALLDALAAHEADVGAHHARYTDAEAVTAVGPHFSGDHDDLTNVRTDQHHARYTDAEAVTAVGPHYNGEELEEDVSMLEEDVNYLGDLLTHFSVVGDDIYITGANLHVRNGVGWTETTNGLGNIIVGYNEERSPTAPECSLYGCTNVRSGSHMLVLGTENNFTAFGGLVAGWWNTASGDYASVSGGRFNTASDLAASVSGGFNNTASYWYASVSGGSGNTASGAYASVSGGAQNTASSSSASVSGGLNNLASWVFASVSGGEENTASGSSASVSGGRFNTASGNFASVSGGENNTAIGQGFHPDTHYP